MSRRGGWRREGSRGHFRYVDARGNRIADDEKLERIRTLVIPPAWKDVWISPRPSAKLQATGVDAAGRKQYLYHPSFRAQQEQAKFDRLISFAQRLPDLRAAMAEHMDKDVLDREQVSAIATRLINSGWFRVGTERYAKESRTFGITTLRKNHVRVRGQRISFQFHGKHRSVIRTTLVDAELAGALNELLALQGGPRLFRYAWDGGLCALTGARLNDYVRTYLGEEFTAKDFRTWGGTLIAAVELAERGPAETEPAARRTVTAVMRRVGAELGNTPAVARSSYVSPAVIDQYLDGTTIEDFRPRHLRIVGARDLGLDLEEQALLSLLRSWRIKQARAAA
ncbi:MAG: DNA topoisomerase IB [Actinobacteria bacterium]|nr:MAG: DNA topoisomerase IB [Actinomycetota bacterium]